MRILIVEDEQKMAKLLKKGLEEENHSVMLAHDGTEGFDISQTYPFDVVILDVMLPGMTGFEVVRRLRHAENHVPILMLTARDAVSDIVKGLHLGADDYLTKPFAFHELLARLQAVSRRGPIERLPKLKIADLVLDSVTHTVRRAGEQIHLTKTEYLLLEFMMRHSGRVLSRNAIVEAIWGFDSEIENNTLDAFLRLLRKKVDSGHAVKLIHTIRGFGYVLREEEPS
ncbi:MAG: DNA-binding response regulator [Acidobacteria bacterium]|nr:MAG: DNA-binding response regulator [Acidobacteriota bacterium]